MSMSEKKPRPPSSAKSPNRCPVCGEDSYSRSGVHPQCSERQADAKRTDRLKREKLAKEKNAAPTANIRSPWQQLCPKCGTVQHVRKAVCGCGHKFAARAGPPTSEGGSP